MTTGRRIARSIRAVAGPPPLTGRRPPRGECNEASQIHTAGGTMEPDRKASD